MNQRVIFSCNCSTERAERALTLLETQEKKEGSFQGAAQTEIRCEYCGKTYMIRAKRPRKKASAKKPAGKGRKKK
jgi:redox-regulated HSP33 family molecular chaperone